MYDIKLFNEIDDIDHFTLAIRKGAALDRGKAIYFIKKYAACYDYVKAVDDRFDCATETFDGFGEKDLYDSLIKIRDAMAAHTQIKGF